MMAFIINSLLESKKQFAISSKKQVNTRRRVIYNMCRLTNHLSVTRSCCKCIVSCLALLSLSLGHHFDNMALRSPTKIEYVGC